jgi:PTH1 family peptidyl-tRNA hydrolase
MRLIVGLGNPGKEYEGTRHNIGVNFLMHLANSLDAELKELPDIAEYAKAKGGVLLFPAQFMNNSGPALKKTLEKLKIKTKPQDILVIHDDLDIEAGRVKMTFAKSSAGHKGVESIVRTLKTEKFWRLRIGIAPKRKVDHKRVKDWILSPFTPAEKKLILKNKKKILEGIHLWIERPDKGMQHINTN